MNSLHNGASFGWVRRFVSDQRKVSLIAVGSLALTLSTSLTYADSCDEGSFRDQLLKRYNDETCLSKNTDLQSRLTVVKKSFNQGNAGVDKSPAIADTQFQLVLVRLKESTINADEKQAKALADLESKLTIASKEATSLQNVGRLFDIKGETAFPTLLVDEWKIKDKRGNAAGSLAAARLEAENCLDSTENRCLSTYQDAIVLADHSFVAAQIVSILNLPLRSGFLYQAKNREERWHAYLYSSQFQYLWELAANRSLEESCPKGLNSWVSTLIGKKCSVREKDNNGNEIGFRDAPDYRVILFHPDLGLEYLQREPAGNQFAPALVFQWVGYQWWDWSGSKISNLYGLSVVTTATDSVNSNKLGFGIQGQCRGYALAVTYHGGAFGFTLNLPLGDRISTLNTEWADKLMGPLK